MKKFKSCPVCNGRVFFKSVNNKYGILFRCKFDDDHTFVYNLSKIDNIITYIKIIYENNYIDIYHDYLDFEDCHGVKFKTKEITAKNINFTTIQELISKINIIKTFG
jgi:hypothetical protein